MRRNMRGLGDSTDPYSADYVDPYNAEMTAATPQDQGIFANFKQKFSDAVAQLDNASAALDQAENNLYAVQYQASLDPNDYAEWQDNFAKVNAAISTRDAARGAVATASGWIGNIKSAFGLSGLGLLPEIPYATVAIITGGAAAIWAVVQAANAFVDKMNLKAWNDENIRRSQNGQIPLPDSTRPVPLSSPSIFAGVTDLSKIIVFGAIAVLILPSLMKRI